MFAPCDKFETKNGIMQEKIKKKNIILKTNEYGQSTTIVVFADADAAFFRLSHNDQF